MLLCFYAVVLCFIPAVLGAGFQPMVGKGGGGSSLQFSGFSPGGLPEWGHLSVSRFGDGWFWPCPALLFGSTLFSAGGGIVAPDQFPTSGICLAGPGCSQCRL